MKNRYLICKRCGGYYKLAEGKAPEDFEKCSCGGELYYETYNEESDAKTLKPELEGKENSETEKAWTPNSRLKNIKNIIMEPGESETEEKAVPTVGNETGRKTVSSGGNETEKKTVPSGEESIEKILPGQKPFLPYDMVFTFLFASLCFLSISVSPFNLHIGETLGTILIVFFPGYALTVISYPEKDSINVWERLGLSMILSLFITFIIVIVNFYSNIAGTTPLFSTASVITMVLALIAVPSLLTVPMEERFYWHPLKSLENLKSSPKGKMSFILVILFLLSVVTIFYLIANPNPGESFTEFYILGPQGMAADYPVNLTAGQEQTVIIGLVNHEHNQTSYRIVVQSNGNIMNQQDISLQQNQRVEIPYNFTMEKSGKVEFLLYKQPDTNVYMSLYLWVNVI